MKNRTSRKAGFTLVEIMIVVAIIGLLAAIAIPNFIKARKTAQSNACINNLRQIDGAIQQWALELNQGSGATTTSTALAPFLGRGNAGKFPSCPAGGVYGPAAFPVNAAPTCSLQVANQVPPYHQLAP